MEIKLELPLDNSARVRAFATFLNAVADENHPSKISEPKKSNKVDGGDPIEVKGEVFAEALVEAVKEIEEKPKSRRRTKAEIEADKAKEEESAPVKETPKNIEKAEVTKAELTPAIEKEKEEGELTLTDVREMLSTKVEDHRDVIKVKMGELGAKSVSSLSEEHYQEFHEFLESL